MNAPGPMAAATHDHGRTTASDVYRDAVLAPLFAAAKAHAELYARIDRAYAVMLTEQGILPAGDGAQLLRALDRVDAALVLDGRDDAGPYEDLFYVREAALREARGQRVSLARMSP